MKKIMIGAFLGIFLVGAAYAGTYTANLGLYKPATGDTNYVTPFANGMDTIDSYLWGVYTSTGNFALKSGDTMTGALTISASSLTVTSVAGTPLLVQVATAAAPVDDTHISYGVHSVNGSGRDNSPAGTAKTPYGVVGEAFSLSAAETGAHSAYGLYGYAHGNSTNYGIYGKADSGSVANYAGYFAGDVLSTGVVTAASFAGPLTGAASANVLKAGDTMTGPLTLSGSSLTVTGTGAGLMSAGNVASSYGAYILNLDNHSASNGVFISNAYNTSATYPLRVQSNIGSVAGALAANGVDLLTVKGDGTVTIPGSAFSVGGSTLVVSGGSVGIGTTAPQTKVDISSGTIHMAGTGTPTTGYALCLTSGGSMGHCTTQPDAGGACTCTTP